MKFITRKEFHGPSSFPCITGPIKEGRTAEEEIAVALSRWTYSEY